MIPLYDGKSHSPKKLCKCPNCGHISKEASMRLHKCGGTDAEEKRIAKMLEEQRKLDKTIRAGFL